MQRKSIPSLRLKTTARQPGRAADGCRASLRPDAPARDWRARIVAVLVREQPSTVFLDRACRSASRYRRRSWWLDTSPVAQSRRAVKRWHGCAQDLWTRNVEIAAWCALGATQAHVGAKYGLSRQRVGQIVREFPWVRTAVEERLESLAAGEQEWGKCQSSLRGPFPSESASIGSIGRCSGEFRPLARPNRRRWRRICDRRGAGSRRRPEGTPPAGSLTAQVLASLAETGAFGSLQPGGKVPVSAWPEIWGKVPVRSHPEPGGKVPSLRVEEIIRRWRLRGGSVWRQRGFPSSWRGVPRR